MTDSATQEPVRSRRAILAAAAGSAAALAATAIGPASVAAIAAPMLTETNNGSTAPTGVTNATADSDAFFGHAAGAGTGLEATTVTGNGVRAISSDASDPTNNTANAGVVGVAGDVANIAANVALTGVYGYSDASTTDGFAAAGLWGQSGDFGVIGEGSVGVFGVGPFGVVGVAEDAKGVGVQAATDVAGAISLQVLGRAEFSRSGRATIAAGQSKKTITLAGCTSSTIIFAVLAANRSGRYVRAAVPGTGQFTVYLNTTVTASTLIAWIAFTNPGNHGG